MNKAREVTLDDIIALLKDAGNVGSPLSAIHSNLDENDEYELVDRRELIKELERRKHSE